MKAAKTLVDSLASMEQVTTTGDLRRIVANSLLALARKEISATDVDAMAKLLESISNNMNAEIKVAKTSIELREKGADLGKVDPLGQRRILGDPAEPQQ